MTVKIMDTTKPDKLFMVFKRLRGDSERVESSYGEIKKLKKEGIVYHNMNYDITPTKFKYVGFQDGTAVFREEAT